MYLPSIVLSKLLGINVNLLIIIMGAIAIGYTFFGGLKSVIWTDFVQGIILVLGVVISLILMEELEKFLKNYFTIISFYHQKI